MTELSGCNAAETRPRAEASTRPCSVWHTSQLISTSYQEAAVNCDQKPSDVHPESVQSVYTLRGVVE